VTWALDLDFLATGRQSRWLGIGLLAIAAIACAGLVDMQDQSQRAIEQMETRLTNGERRLRGKDTQAPKLADATVQEIRAVNQVIDQITLPWDRLFLALESASNAKVALLGISPDRTGGLVELSAEAMNSEAMFDYVKRLQASPALTRVYLLNHQVNLKDSLRPVRFTVSASWIEKT
jgi:Tfp pilus assembly protein PilN